MSHKPGKPMVYSEKPIKSRTLDLMHRQAQSTNVRPIVIPNQPIHRPPSSGLASKLEQSSYKRPTGGGVPF